MFPLSFMQSHLYLQELTLVVLKKSKEAISGLLVLQDQGGSKEPLPTKELLILLNHCIDGTRGKFASHLQLYFYLLQHTWFTT